MVVRCDCFDWRRRDAVHGLYFIQQRAVSTSVATLQDTASFQLLLQCFLFLQKRRLALCEAFNKVLVVLELSSRGFLELEQLQLQLWGCEGGRQYRIVSGMIVVDDTSVQCVGVMRMVRIRRVKSGTRFRSNCSYRCVYYWNLRRRQRLRAQRQDAILFERLLVWLRMACCVIERGLSRTRMNQHLYLLLCLLLCLVLMRRVHEHHLMQTLHCIDTVATAVGCVMGRW